MANSLSPSAQAVQDAAYTLAIGAGLRTRVAAALRAAAKQSIFADTKVGRTDEVVLVDTLLAIAAELDNS